MSLTNYQKKAWNELENIRIIKNSGGNTVAIYFSSNNLYYPDTEDCFVKTIYEKDRYEWTRMMIKRASKHIFVRDVYKTWYVTGINSSTSSIPLLLERLKKEVKGYDEIVTVGSSAGGFAASYFGSCLNADIVFNFNGQWEINSVIERNGYSSLKKLHESCGDFFDIVKYIRNSQNIFYFISEKSRWDIAQEKYSQILPLNRIFFSTSHHGIPFLKVALPYVLNMDKKHLSDFSDRHFNPFIFTVKCVGLHKALNGLYKQFKEKYLK